MLKNDAITWSETSGNVKKQHLVNTVGKATHFNELLLDNNRLILKQVGEHCHVGT